MVTYSKLIIKLRTSSSRFNNYIKKNKLTTKEHFYTNIQPLKYLYKTSLEQKEGERLKVDDSSSYYSKLRSLAEYLDLVRIKLQ